MSEDKEKLLQTAIEHHKLAIESYDRRESRFLAWFNLGIAAQAILYAGYIQLLIKTLGIQCGTSNRVLLLLTIMVAIGGLVLAYLWTRNILRFKDKNSALQRTIIWLENKIQDISTKDNSTKKDSPSIQEITALLQKANWFEKEKIAPKFEVP